MLRCAPNQLVELRNTFLIDEAVSVLRHDLRNRLASIRNAGYFLKRKAESSAPAFAQEKRPQQMFQLIESEVAAAEVSLRPNMPAPDPDVSADARDVVQNMAGWLELPEAIQLRVLESDAVPVSVSAQEMELAIYCLVENAVDAFGEDAGGTVSIRCEDQNQRGVIEVCDDGPGFAPGAESRYLEPFFTTRPGRFGLGLNIARRVAIRVGGSVEASGAAEGGVSVRLIFPGRQS